VYNVLQACRESGCPLCRLEQQSVERYLDNQFYENVNSTKWRDQLRASLGFCYEHAWLGVDQRLGDALGYSIIYRDLINSVLRHWKKDSGSTPTPARRPSLRRQLPESARNLIEKVREALIPRKRCPVCEQRDHTARTYISVLLEQLGTPEMISALQASEGLCLPHLHLVLERAKDGPASEQLLDIHRPKLESLRAELEEFIRKNDYQAVNEGIGKEGDAWLRAISMVVGKRKAK
jgi:hypothetical protein